MKKYVSVISLMLLALFCLGACKTEQKESRSGLKIVTSFYPIYSLVKEIAGPDNQVLMLASQKGIHDYEPSVAEMKEVYDADLFVYHSEHLEAWAKQMDPNLQKSKLTVLEASQGLLKPQKGLEDDQVLDPHSWLDPLSWAEEGVKVAESLSQLDPDHAKDYQKRAEELKQKCQKLVKTYQDQFSQLDFKSFVTQHTAFSYLADRFGLEQIGIAGISPDQEPNARDLMQIHDFLKEKGIKKIFLESQASPKIAQELSKSLGIELAVLDPLEAVPDNDQSYLENMENNLKVLLEALKGEKK